SRRPGLASRRKRAQPEAAVLFVRGRDDREGFAPRAIRKLRAVRIGERRREQRLDARKPGGRERERATGVHAADGAARTRREADELGGTALHTARQVRQVA